MSSMWSWQLAACSCSGGGWWSVKRLGNLSRVLVVETNVHQRQVLFQRLFVRAVLQVLLQPLVKLFHKPFLLPLRLHSFLFFLLELLHNDKVRLAIAIVIVLRISRKFGFDPVTL